MGRSTNYLTNALRVNYFEWPEVDGNYEESEFVIEDIQETIKSEYPEFKNTDKWDGREVHIILEGYGLQIGLSEYCGIATLSARYNEDLADYANDDEQAAEWVKSAEKWLDENWDKATKYWNRYRKIGTFSNGCAVLEQVN